MNRMQVRGQGTLVNGVAIIAIAAAIAAALSACSTLHTVGASVASVGHDISESTHLAPLGVNPASPVAADVDRAEHTNAPIPSFASIPPKPTDVRPAAAYKTQVVDLIGDRRTLAKWETANPPMNTDTEAYVAAQRAKVAGEPAVSEAGGQAESEAFAKKLREAASAPSKSPAPKASTSKSKSDKAGKPVPSPN